MATHEADQRIASVASHQHGVFSRRQALDAGATPKLIEVRLRQGRWVRLDTAVYGLAGHPDTWPRQLMAAVVGERDAVVSGPAAAALHTLPGFHPCEPHLTIPRGTGTRSHLAAVRRSSWIERTEVDGIPVTPIVRTLFDLAAHPVPTAALVRALDEALASRRVTLRLLERRLDAVAPRRDRGVATMRRLIEARRAGQAIPESELEALLHEILADERVPPWVAQAPLPWESESRRRVDVLIPSWRLIIEADGRRWHTRDQDFQRDRERDNLAAAHGYRVLRFTWQDLTERPRYVLEMILAVGDVAAQ
ncbi:MAG: DUF559 domain-containing protein [Acidimicrobiales bacterium]|jgi:predicted transcriptional regulator of viral defense system|nr:DUF559 domain-containing protein [Acidimicrobiales bacterium]